MWPYPFLHFRPSSVSGPATNLFSAPIRPAPGRPPPPSGAVHRVDHFLPPPRSQHIDVQPMARPPAAGTPVGWSWSSIGTTTAQLLAAADAWDRGCRVSTGPIAPAARVTVTLASRRRRAYPKVVTGLVTWPSICLLPRSLDDTVDDCGHWPDAPAVSVIDLPTTAVNWPGPHPSLGLV